MNLNVIVFMDTETCGISAFFNRILEISVVITDWELNEKERKTYTIHYTQEQIDKWIKFIYEMHTKNGLVDDVLKSETTLEEAENGLIEMLKKYEVPKTKFICGGNNVSFDLRFLKAHMPTLYKKLHYRTMDATTLWLGCEQWYGLKYVKADDVNYRHRAMDDILFCIDSMKFYKKHLCVKKDEQSNVSKIL